MFNPYWSWCRLSRSWGGGGGPPRRTGVAARAAECYPAFVALVLVTVGYTCVLFQAKAVRRFAVGPLVTAVLLVGVLLTPTRTTLHDGIAAAVLVWVTVFFAVRWLDVSVWVAVGWLVGVIVVAGVLVFVSPPWAQKVLVACQVVAMNVDAMRVARTRKCEDNV